MRRQKLTISRKKTAGGQYGTSKVAKLLEKNAGGQNVTPKLHKNKKQILSISLSMVFPTDSEFRNPSPRFFYQKKCNNWLSMQFTTLLEIVTSRLSQLSQSQYNPRGGWNKVGGSDNIVMQQGSPNRGTQRAKSDSAIIHEWRPR